MKGGKRRNFREAPHGKVVEKLSSVEEVHHEVQLRLGLERVAQTTRDITRSAPPNQEGVGDILHNSPLSKGMLVLLQSREYAPHSPYSITLCLFRTFIAYIFPFSFMRT